MLHRRSRAYARFVRRAVLLPLSLLSIGAPLVGQARRITLTGTVFDNDYPIASVHVRVSGPGGIRWLDSTVTDTTGAFRLEFRFAPGCYRLQARSLGFAITEWTFNVSAPGSREFGRLPLRWAPIPEWRALLLLGCAYPKAGAGASATDTVIVRP